jgi:hypothetical protein
MTRAAHGLLVSSVAVGALLLGAAPPASGNGASIPLDEAEILAELNDTDGDLGFHALLDGEAWDRLILKDPNGRQVLSVRPGRSLAEQGLTELFFESDEPAFEELSPAEFFERFPEGRYTISGRTLEGDRLAGTAKFSHRMPAPVGNVLVSGVPLAEDCEGEDPPVVGEPVVISWDPVTTAHPEIGNPTAPAPIVIERYQVVVEREEPTLLVHSIDLPGDLSAYEITVPAEFIALGTEFKYEIVVRARNDNQTALESCFALE